MSEISSILYFKTRDLSVINGDKENNTADIIIAEVCIIETFEISDVNIFFCMMKNILADIIILAIIMIAF